MGNCASTTEPEGASLNELQHSRIIEKELKEAEKRMAKEVKILLLGAGEAGKTTVLKQLRVINDRKFNAFEVEQYRKQIFHNLCDGIRYAPEVLEEWELSLADPANEAHAAFLREPLPSVLDDDRFPPAYLVPLKALYADEAIQRLIVKGNEAALPESVFSYFLPIMDKLFAPGYVPSDADIFRARGKTTGITETTFKAHGLEYRVFDVGGQRSERRKWIHCFENVTCLIFLAAISAYDQTLLEDRESNSLQEAMMLFESVANARWFSNTSIVLFLNKIDLLEHKLPHSPFNKYFEDYAGRNDDYFAIREFLKKRFTRLNRSALKDVYPHYTCALDTKLMQTTMIAVQDIVITSNLNTLGAL